MVLYALHPRSLRRNGQHFPTKVSELGHWTYLATQCFHDFQVLFDANDIQKRYLKGSIGEVMAIKHLAKCDYQPYCFERWSNHLVEDPCWHEQFVKFACTDLPPVEQEKVPKSLTASTFLKLHGKKHIAVNVCHQLFSFYRPTPYFPDVSIENRRDLYFPRIVCLLAAIPDFLRLSWISAEKCMLLRTTQPFSSTLLWRE